MKKFALVINSSVPNTSSLRAQRSLVVRRSLVGAVATTGISVHPILVDASASTRLQQTTRLQLLAKTELVI